MRQKLLPLTEMVAVGATIFSMHFGGASMIWPVTWGKLAGGDVFRVYLGIFPTALFLPWVAYYGVVRGGSLGAMARRVGRPFEWSFAMPAMLVIGPLFTIPRMSAASWDALSTLVGFSSDLLIPRIVFQIAYYFLTYWFLAKLSAIVDKMSKYLVPFLLIMVSAIILKGIITPIDDWATPAYGGQPWSWGFVQGYQTSELLVALAFAGLIITDLHGRGIVEREDQVKNLMVAAAIGIGLLCLTHLGHMYLGARTGSAFAHLEYATLYSSVVMALWGKTGGVLFNLGLLLAALTTAIGCTAGVAFYLEEFSNQRLSYNKAAILILIVSTLVSSLGLSRIIELTAPVFSVIYPPAIVLTVLYSVLTPYKDARHAKIVAAAAWASLFFGLLDGLCAWTGANSIEALTYPGFVGLLARASATLPGGTQGLGWVVPSLIVAFLTWLMQFVQGVIGEKGLDR